MYTTRENVWGKYVRQINNKWSKRKKRGGNGSRKRDRSRAAARGAGVDAGVKQGEDEGSDEPPSVNGDAARLFNASKLAKILGT